MDIYHVSRSTIAVTESFTSGKKMPIEEGIEVVFLAARLRSEIFQCKYLFTISSFNSVEYFFFPDIIKITPFIRHLFCLTKGGTSLLGAVIAFFIIYFLLSVFQVRRQAMRR